MTKMCKRHKNKQKQKQLKAKRNWLLNRPAKVRRKSNKIGSNDTSSGLDAHDPTSKFSNLKAESNTSGQDLSRGVSSISAKRFARCVIGSLSHTASRPVHFLCTCMVLCTNSIHRSFDVVNRGKKNVHTAVTGSMATGYSKLIKMVGYVGDTVFPSRPYKRKLDEMSDRLEEVERELKRLKRDVTISSQQMSNTTIPITMPIPTGPTIVPAPPSLPPPPPPPPPPVCKPPPVVTFKKKLKADNVEENKKVPAKVGISLAELTSVKLRKVMTHEDRSCDKENARFPLTFGLKKCPGGRFVSPRGKDSNKHPFITLKDIRKVSLRKTQAIGNTGKKRSPSHSKIAFLRHNLRKVETKRSPGGTPVAEQRQQSFGEGLTPIMTRALQRKFKFANPPSPVDSFNQTKSFLEKTFTAQTSPYSPTTRLKAIR